MVIYIVTIIICILTIVAAFIFGKMYVGTYYGGDILAILASASIFYGLITALSGANGLCTNAALARFRLLSG
jgi:hypothetical protein